MLKPVSREYELGLYFCEEVKVVCMLTTFW